MLDDLEKDQQANLEDSVYLRMEDTEGQTDVEELTSDTLPTELVEELTSDSLASDSSDLLLHAAPLEISYENMTLKDLQTLAKSRHITGVSTMKKSALVDALKASQQDALVVEEIVA